MLFFIFKEQWTSWRLLILLLIGSLCCEKLHYLAGKTNRLWHTSTMPLAPALCDQCLQCFVTLKYSVPIVVVIFRTQELIYNPIITEDRQNRVGYSWAIRHLPQAVETICVILHLTPINQSEMIHNARWTYTLRLRLECPRHAAVRK